MSYPEALHIGPATCTYATGEEWPTEILAVHPREWRTLSGRIQDGWVYTIWNRAKSRTTRLGHEWLTARNP